MSNLQTMAIPIEADGIVDDEQEFEKQQAKNEAKLAKEIQKSNADELALGDYEDIQGEFVSKPKYREYSPKALDRVQARKIGRVAILFGSR